MLVLSRSATVLVLVIETSPGNAESSAESCAEIDYNFFSSTSTKANALRGRSGGLMPNTAQLTIPKSPLTNPSGFHCPQPSELIFLPSNLFAKTDPGCPATTAMFQQKHVLQKKQHNHRTTFASSSSPALCAQHRSMDHAKSIPPGFTARNPANSFFCPQIFLPKPIPDVLLPRQCFSKNMCCKKISITTARHLPHPSSPALCAQHRSMDHAKRTQG